MDLVWDLESASQMSSVASEAASNSLSYVASMAASLVNMDNGTEGIPDTEMPVWIMGKSYSAIYDKDELRDEVQSRLWFSYRKDFADIGQSGLTSDRGWGCMLRCGQMVLAESFIRLAFGRQFRWRPDLCDDLPNDYFNILEKFADHKDSVYSIHNIALTGEQSENRPVGTWFGPNTVAQTIKRLSLGDAAHRINIHVAMDNLVVIDHIKCDPWLPSLVIIPLRLGISTINPLYFNDLKTCFELESCVGVIGGRPNHALFFFGCVNDDLICLDPHVTQPTVQFYGAEPKFESYHTTKCHRIGIQQLDPSLAICFFSKTEPEFDTLCQKLSDQFVRGHSSPMFEIRRSLPNFQEELDGFHSGEAEFSNQVQKLSEDEEDFELI